jgi:hypothetical protein
VPPSGSANPMLGRPSLGIFGGRNSRHGTPLLQGEVCFSAKCSHGSYVLVSPAVRQGERHGEKAAAGGQMDGGPAFGGKLRGELFGVFRCVDVGVRSSGYMWWFIFLGHKNVF